MSARVREQVWVVLVAATSLSRPVTVLRTTDEDEARAVARRINEHFPGSLCWAEPWDTGWRVDPEAGDLEAGYVKQLARCDDRDGQEGDQDEDQDEDSSWETYKRRVAQLRRRDGGAAE
jgi:hypothetical protein